MQAASWPECAGIKLQVISTSQVQAGHGAYYGLLFLRRSECTLHCKVLPTVSCTSLLQCRAEMHVVVDHSTQKNISLQSSPQRHALLRISCLISLAAIMQSNHVPWVQLMCRNHRDVQDGNHHQLRSYGRTHFSIGLDANIVRKLDMLGQFGAPCLCPQRDCSFVQCHCRQQLPDSLFTWYAFVYQSPIACMAVHRW